MRFPLRDVIPTTTRPIVSVTLAVLLAAGAVLHPPPAALAGTLVRLCLHLGPLVVLGATLEDQLGHVRFAALLALSVLLGAWADSAPPTVHTAMLYLAAATLAGHLTLFPASRIVVSVGVAAAEVPSFFAAGVWVLAVVFTRTPLAGATLTLALSALAVRRLRRADRATWTYWDTAR